jgi:glutamate/tyrosine decarboxylase-like PLP-dependent enzyme
MAGDGQQSSEQATRNGIQALESAFSGIMKARQDVDGTRATLTGDDLRARLGGPLPDRGEDPIHVLDTIADAGLTGTVASQGPRYFGFVTGGSIPSAIVTDWLVSAWDQNAQMFVMSPIAAVLEQIVAGWLTEIFGLPPAWSVGFVTGAQMANFTALLTARHHLLRQAGWDVERQGLFGAPPIEVVVSDESHRTIFTALRMLGLGAERVQRVATDAHGRMRPDDLETILRRNHGPCIVCTQIGNVNTGAADPILAIAPLTRARGAWLHVDGAFGLWAAASPSLRSITAGIDQADSLATDGHKWLNVPYDSGLAFVRDAPAHHAAMTLGAEYYVETEGGERDNYNWTPESSRRARGFSVLAAVRSLGRSGVVDLIERNCAHARRMAERLSAGPRVRILNDVVLNQVLVRFGDSDDRTRAVVDGVQREGTCWLSGTVWHGVAAMRISVSNWTTTEADVDASVDAILRVASETTVESTHRQGV